MIFPDSLTIVVTDKATGEPVPEIALLMTLRPERKNNHHVGPVFTDEHGSATFTREDCIAEIKANQNLFIMDYSGDLSTCSSTAIVRLLPPKNVAFILDQVLNAGIYRDIYFKLPYMPAKDEFISRLGRAKNALYKPTEIELHVDKDMKPIKLLRNEIGDARFATLLLEKL